MLIGLGAGFTIVGSRYSPDTRRLREFCARNRLPHRWIDVEEDQEAEALLREVGVTPEETPVVIWRGREVLRNPSNAELARRIGLRASSPEGVCDLVVVGTGPSGLAASVYGASEGLETVALDAVATGGQAGTASKIENYLGFPSGISGAELAERATIQAEKFGARISVPAEASALSEEDGHYIVTLDDGEQVAARTVVIATGVRYRKLDVPRMEEFEAASVYYAATLMEARLCTGDPVAVVGGGNSAGQATLFLARYANPVHLIVREADLAENMSRYLIDRIEQSPAVQVHLHTEVRELIGEHGILDGVVVEDNQTGERSRLDARMLFVFIGALPHTRWLADQVALDERGFILTGPQAARNREECRGRRPAAAARDEPPRGARRRGRAQRVDQARRVGRGRGRDGRPHGVRAPHGRPSRPAALRSLPGGVAATRLTALRRGYPLEHAVQVRGGGLDVVVLALRRARLGGQHAAAVHVLEVAVGELVVPLRVLGRLVVDAEMPLAVLAVAVLFDEPVLLRGRRLVLAPIVAFVEDHVPFPDQLLCVVVCPVAEFHRHGGLLSSLRA